MSVSMISVKRALQFTSATGIAYGLRFVPQLPRACANRIECARELNCIALTSRFEKNRAMTMALAEKRGRRREEIFRLTHPVVRSSQCMNRR